MLLNNDAFPEPGFLAALAAAAARRPEAAMLACRILFEQTPDRVDNLGHLLYWDGLNRGRGRMRRADDPAWEGEQEVFFPSGCAGAYRADLLAEVGLFDEWFHSYGEDADLGLRCRRAGARCFYVPDALVYHRFSASAGAHSARKAFLVERNRIAVLVRNLPWPLLLLSPAATLWRLLLHFLAALLGRGSAGEGSRSTGPLPLALALLSAWGSALAALPRLLADRRRIMRRGRLGTREMLGLCIRFRVSAWTIAFGDQAPAADRPPGSPARPPLLLLGLLVLAAVGLRALGAMRAGYLPDGDAVAYLAVARNVAEGRGLAADVLRALPGPRSFPAPADSYPLLPLATGLLGRAGLDLETAAMGLGLLLLAAGCLALFRLAHTLLPEGGAGAWLALLPVALLGLHRHLTLATCEPLTDGPALGLNILCLLALARAVARPADATRSLARAALAGLCALLAGLMRFQCLYLVALGPLFLALAGRRRLALPAAFLAPALLGWSVYALSQGHLLGPLAPHAARLWQALAASGGGAPLGLVLELPSILGALRVALDPCSPHSLFAGLGPLLWFGLLGLALAIAGRAWRLLALTLPAFLLGLFTLCLVPTEAGWHHPWLFADRPALQLLPPVLLWAAAPLWLLENRRLRALVLLLLLGLLAWEGRGALRYAWKRGRLQEPPELSLALDTLRRAPEAQGLIFSPEARFLSWRLRMLGFQGRDPYTLEQVLATLPGSGVSLLVVYSRWDAGLPWARALLDAPADALPAGLQLLAESTGGGESIRLLKWSG